MEGFFISKENPFVRQSLAIITSILLVVCGFLAGFYWNQSAEKGAVQITLAQSNSPQDQEKNVLQINNEKTALPITSECAFIASKKGEKYHGGKTHVANQIKPENLLCFTSKEEAEAKGLRPGVLE